MCFSTQKRARSKPGFVAKQQKARKRTPPARRISALLKNAKNHQKTTKKSPAAGVLLKNYLKNPPEGRLVFYKIKPCEARLIFCVLLKNTKNINQPPTYEFVKHKLVSGSGTNHARPLKPFTFRRRRKEPGACLVL